MSKKYFSLFIIIVIIISISGCTTKNATNGTFGEKNISISNLTIINNVTTSNYDKNGVNYYYIDGFIKNNDKYDAYHVKMKATVYDANGNIVATDNSTHLEPDYVPAGSESEFIFSFKDPDRKIVRYDLKILNVEYQF